MPSTKPNDALNGASSETIECAAIPPKRARARSPRKWARARPRADRMPCQPNRASGTERCGGRRGASMPSSSRSQLAASGPMSFAYAGPSAPSPAAVSAIERWSRMAVPSSSGCARGASGWIHWRPKSPSGNDRKNGDATARGWMAEQISCTKPGSVSVPDRVPPPIVSAASMTVTERPARARVTAAARPLGPDPTTMYRRPLPITNRGGVAGKTEGPRPHRPAHSIACVDCASETTREAHET